MSAKLSVRSEKNLVGVHPDLVRVVRTANAATGEGTPIPGFTVIEGLRTKDRQSALVRAGASWTMNSRHLTGHAVDLAVWVESEKDIRWEWRLYEALSKIVLQAAKDESVNLVWGGSWTTRDGPHFELNRDVYPA